MYRNLNLLDPPFIARLASGGGGFACADYTPGQATNLFTPYGGTLDIFGQSDVDLLAGFDGVDGILNISDTASITDAGPLNALTEITGRLLVSVSCDLTVIPMTALRFVGENVFLDIDATALTANGFAFNLTRVTGTIRIRAGGALTSLGVDFMRHLFFADILNFQLTPTANVTLNGLFPCFTGNSVEFGALPVTT